MLYIGSRIQVYRKKAELSQEEFADKIGVSRQAVSKWERDKAYPDLDRLVCICEILDVQMDELIYGEERKKQGELTQENLASNNIVHMKNLRGRNRVMRLKVIFGIMTVLCIFSIVMMLCCLSGMSGATIKIKTIMYVLRRCTSSIQRLICVILMMMEER